MSIKVFCQPNLYKGKNRPQNPHHVRDSLREAEACAVVKKAVVSRRQSFCQRFGVVYGRQQDDLALKGSPARLMQLQDLVGVRRFELRASWSQTKRSTKLSYTPDT